MRKTKRNKMPRKSSLLLAVLWSAGASAGMPKFASPSSPPVLKTIEIEWEPVEKTGGYEVRLAPVNGGRPLRFFTTESRMVQDVPVGAYRMQIRSRAKDVDYFSPWSESVPVEVVAKEITPLKPEDHATMSAVGLEKYVVEFEWLPVTGVKDYTLKVWNEHRKDKPWVFVTRATSKKLEVPPGDVYYWQVLFESANAVSYAQSPTTFTFTVLGMKLTTPEILPPDPRDTKQLAWRESDGATTYQAKLYYRHLDETKWRLIDQLQTGETEWNFEKLKRGAYKIEVRATAARRASSDVAELEFVVKPSDEELTQAMQ